MSLILDKTSSKEQCKRLAYDRLEENQHVDLVSQYLRYTTSFKL